MIPYYFFLLIPIILTFNNNIRINRVSFNVFILLLIFFIGMRFEVGGDWDNYYRLFLKMNNYNFIDIFFLNKEPGFILINYIFRLFNLGFYSINLFAAFVFICGFYTIIIKLKDPWIALILSLPYFIFVFAMGATQQSIATGFILLAFNYLSKKNNIKFILFVIIATLFHYTAIFIIIFIFSNLELNRKNIINLVIFFLFSSLIFLPILIKQYLPYLTENIRQTTANGVYFRIIPLLLSAFCYIYLVNKKIFDFEDNKIWLLMSCISLIFIILIFNFSAAIDRFAYYFFVLQIITVSRILEVLKDPKHIVIIKLLICLYSIMTFYIWFNFSNHFYMHVPYNSIVLIN